MRLNITRRLFLTFLAFGLLMVVSLWALQRFFLPDYYYQENVKQLEKQLYAVENYLQSDTLTQERMDWLTSYQGRINARVTVYNHQGMVQYDLYNAQDMRVTDLQVLMQQSSYARLGIEASFPLLFVYIKGETYLYRISIPYQSIDESLEIINQMYLYIILLAILMPFILSFWFSKALSKPLVTLNNVARQMGNLDFSARFTENRIDEIGELGLTLNYLMETLDTTINQLKKELEKEKQVEKMRKSFVSRVSHELQTPIAVLSGLLESFADGFVEDNQAFYQSSQEEIHKMSRLVSDMLDLSQLESGSFHVQKDVIDYAVLLERIQEKFARLHLLKRLSFTYDQAYLKVEVDEMRIEQVLFNIINNALHYADVSTQILIDVKTTSKAVITTIENEGPPIDEEDLDHIFESFYKGKNAKAGTGLGLAITKNIIEKHQGTIGVENTLKGVRFTFSLPKYKDV